MRSGSLTHLNSSASPSTMASRPHSLLYLVLATERDVQLFAHTGALQQRAGSLLVRCEPRAAAHDN